MERSCAAVRAKPRVAWCRPKTCCEPTRKRRPDRESSFRNRNSVKRDCCSRFPQFGSKLNGALQGVVPARASKNGHPIEHKAALRIQCRVVRAGKPNRWDSLLHERSRHVVSPRIVHRFRQSGRSRRQAKTRVIQFSRRRGSCNRPSSSTGRLGKRANKASAYSPRPFLLGGPLPR